MNGMARIGRATERRRNELDRVSEQQAKNGIVNGSALFEAPSGFGQGFVELSFPVVYTERPVLSTGWVLEDNEPVLGVIPLISIGVVTWRRREQTDDRIYWVGAQLGVRIQAWAGIHVWIDYTFTAVSLQNPVTGSGGLQETL